jgi:mannosyl-3-phosphoglycerate phosphatase family protein
MRAHGGLRLRHRVVTQPPLVVVTDLDGTLLDHDTYAFDAARPALDQLRRDGVPVVLCTSKTRAETEQLRVAMDNTHPFIVENGGAVVIPEGYFALPIEAERAELRGGMMLIVIGDPYPDLVSTLARASRETDVRVRGFADMTDIEVAEATGLPADQASLARRREFDEPFEVLDGRDATPLLDAIVRLGKRWTAGGRFFHITGASDKARAVRVLADLYRRERGQITMMGLGDAPNDVAFLREVDIPVVVASRRSAEVARDVPGATVTRLTGPAGWNEAVLAHLSSRVAQRRGI